MIHSWFDGLMIGLGLFMAIGAQSAFVLKQGLIGDKAFLAATVSFLCDTFLLTLGVMGLGKVIAQSDVLLKFASIGGGCFLIFYAFRSLYQAYQAIGIDFSGTVVSSTSSRAIILSSIGFSLINPHAWLDAVVLIGSISTRYDGNNRWWFYLGTIASSAAWLYGLAVGAKILQPLFRKQLTWRLLHILIAVMLLVIAWGLLYPYFT